MYDALANVRKEPDGRWQYEVALIRGVGAVGRERKLPRAKPEGRETESIAAASDFNLVLTPAADNAPAGNDLFASREQHLASPAARVIVPYSKPAIDATRMAGAVFAPSAAH